MTQLAGPGLDREIARSVFAEEPVRVPPYSTDDRAADLLLWRIAQEGVGFEVQEVDGRHCCMLWRSAPTGRRLTVAHSDSRPLAIARAALALCAEASLPAAGLPRPMPPARARS
jgi:hypothetical protein